MPHRRAWLATTDPRHRAGAGRGMINKTKIPLHLHLSTSRSLPPAPAGESLSPRRRCHHLPQVMELIFEKAVDEPGFSVAYARMCQVLQLATEGSEGLRAGLGRGRARDGL